MRKLFVLAAAMVVGLSMTAYAADPIRIGAIEDLTGPTAKYGVPIRNGFELAAGEINAQGGILGGRSLELIFEDAAGQKEPAINAAKKLIARDKVAVLLGPTLSNQMFAVGPVAVERQIPIIATSNTAKGITDIGDWVFRTSLPESEVFPVAMKKARDKFGIKTVALMYANDDAMSKSGFDVFRENIEKSGIAIAAIESFSTKDTDFSAQLTKVRSLNVDAIVVSALAEAGGGLVLQARQLGIPASVPIIGGNGFNSPKVAEIAGAAADGTIVGSAWFIGKPDPANRKFVEAYRAKVGQDPDQFAAQAYDTLYILAAAFERAGGTDADKLRQALLVTNYEGAMGPFRFTDHRNPGATEGVVVLTIKDGKFVILP